MATLAVNSQTVTFYLLKNGDEAKRFYMACRLAQIALQKAQCLYIHLDTVGEAQYLDEYLWTFQDTSFIPHAIARDKTDDQCPITLGYDATNMAKHSDCLLNLSVNIPVFYTEFKRIFEIVPKEGELKGIMRSHYRDYQQQGCQLKTHEVTA